MHPKILWPDNKKFAFAIFDDTDRANLRDNQLIYQSTNNNNPKWDISKLIRIFTINEGDNGIFKKIVTFKIDSEPNAMGSEELKKIAIKLGYETVDAKNFKEGLKIISSKSKKIILVFGSLYGVGSVLKFN